MSTRLWGPAAAFALLAPVATRAAEAPVTISAVRVEKKMNTVGVRKGEDYLRVTFTATPNEKIGSKMTIRVRGKARGSVLARTDDISALTLKLDTIDPGTGRDVTVPLFMRESLPSGLKDTQLSFALVRTLEKYGKDLAQFCWDGGSVKPGACP